MITIICGNVDCRRTFIAEESDSIRHATCPSCGGALPTYANGSLKQRVSLRDLIEAGQPPSGAMCGASERQPVVVTCQNSACGAKIKAFPDKISEGARCPKCGTPIAVAAVKQVSTIVAPQKRLPVEPEAFIRFRCYGCGVTIKAPEVRVGEQSQCPRCGHAVVVGQNRIDMPTPMAGTVKQGTRPAVPPPLPNRDGGADWAEAERKAAEEAARAKAEAERKVAEETARAKAVAEGNVAEEAARAKAVAERKVAEETARAKAVAERKAAEEAARAKAEAERKVAEETARAKAVAERKAAEEAARAKAEAERKVAEETARAKAVAERKAAEEAARAKAVAEGNVAEEAARAKAEAERKAAEEAARAKAVAERKVAEETARAKAVAERKAAEEAARAKAVAERKVAEEAARAKAVAERNAAEEAARAKAKATPKVAPKPKQEVANKSAVPTAADEIFGPEKLDTKESPQQGSIKVAQLSRLMSMSLGTFLGLEVPAAVYLRNGFRYIGVAAHAQDSQIEAESVRFRNIYSFDPAAALVGCIRVGYDDLMPSAEMLECMAQLRDPRYRVMFELFWPHVSDEVFDLIRAEGSLTSPKVIQRLDSIAAGSGLEALLAKHALAIACHNLAIAREIDFSTGKGQWSEVCWRKALHYWSEALNSEEFWKYIQKRIASFDDPRVKLSDLGHLREQMPAAILGVNALFARTYEQSGNHRACCRHLRFISESALPDAAKRTASGATVKYIAAARLDPIVQKVGKAFSNPTTKFNRQQFNKECAPLLQEIWDVCHFFSVDLKLSSDAIAAAECDPICQAILDALNTKLTYKEDRERNLLYGMLIVKRMLRLPLSSAMRRKLEESLRSDTGHLYKDWIPAGCIIDPTSCWFMEWEEADPDASILIQIYKVTGRNVEVNTMAGTAGVRLSYNARELLIPRSIRARDFHAGRTKKDDFPGTRVQGGAPRFWTPPSPQANKTFAFGNRKAANILEVLEWMNQDPHGFIEAMSSGALSQWFEHRGQKALTTRVRELEKSSDCAASLMQLLLEATRCEVEAAIEKDEAEYRASCTQAQHEVEKCRVKETAAVNAAVQKHVELTATQSKADRKRIAQVAAWLKEQMAAANKLYSEAAAEVSRRAAEPMALGKADRDAALEKQAGLRGATNLELPLLAGFAPGMCAVGLLLRFLGLGGAWWLAPAIGLAFGTAAAFGIGRAVRMRRMTIASARLLAAKKAWDEELAPLKAENEKKVTHLQRQAAKASAEAAARLKVVEDGIKAIEQAGQERIAAFQSQWHQKLAERKAAIDTASESLRKRLTVSLARKPESAKSDFPAYKGAKSNGFKHGTEPPTSECEMTYSERSDAQRRLGR